MDQTIPKGNPGKYFRPKAVRCAIEKAVDRVHLPIVPFHRQRRRGASLRHLIGSQGQQGRGRGPGKEERGAETPDNACPRLIPRLSLCARRLEAPRDCHSMSNREA